MLYAIISTDIENSDLLRKKTRADHLKRLEELKQQGRLILAGPHPSTKPSSSTGQFSGSLIVAEFDDLKHAQAWADSDPYVAAGVYADVIVKPFKHVLP